MNADTAQIEGSAPAGALPEAPRMSAPETLVGIFTKPRQTFQALEHKPRILAPLLVVLILNLIFGLVMTHSGIIKSDTLARLEAKNAPQEQIDATEKVLDGPIKYVFVVFGPIVVVFSLLVGAALIYFIANLMLGARLRYIHYLCIAAYGAVVGLLDQLVRLGVGLSRGTLQVHLGIGAFMGEEMNGLMRILDTATDPLLLWATAIEALGVAVMAKKGFGFGVLAVLPGYLILVSLSALQR